MVNTWKNSHLLARRIQDCTVKEKLLKIVSGNSKVIIETDYCEEIVNNIIKEFNLEDRDDRG